MHGGRHVGIQQHRRPEVRVDELHGIGRGNPRIAGKAGKPLSGDWQPEGGRILRDAAGMPTGVLVDGASSLVRAHEPSSFSTLPVRRVRAAPAWFLQPGSYSTP